MGDERVEVDARYEGREQHGEASFHADDGGRRIEWSALSGYHGWMKVDPDDGGSRLTRRSSEPAIYACFDRPLNANGSTSPREMPTLLSDVSSS